MNSTDLNIICSRCSPCTTHMAEEGATYLTAAGDKYHPAPAAMFYGLP